MIDKNDPRLTDFVMGELSADQRSAIESQLVSDPELAHAVNELREKFDMIRSVYQAESELTLPDTRRYELDLDEMNRPPTGPDLRAEPAKALTPAKLGNGSRFRLFALAACLAGLIVGGSIWYSNFAASDRLAVRFADADVPIKPADEMMSKRIEELGERLGESVPRPSESPFEGVENSGGDNGKRLDEIGGSAPDRFGLDSKEIADPMDSAVSSADARNGQNQRKRNYSGIQPSDEKFGFFEYEDEDLLRTQSTEGIDSGGWTYHTPLDLNGRFTIGKDELVELDLRSNIPSFEALDLQTRVNPSGTKEIQINQLGRESILSSIASDEGKSLNETEKTDQRKGQAFGEGNKKGGRQQAGDNSESVNDHTWKRVKAIPNTTRLMIGEDDELAMRGMQVNVQIDGFRARVLIDCFYFNDRDQSLEGNFKLRLPDDASLYYFAFGESAYQYKPKYDWDTADWSHQEFQNDETEFVSFQPDDIRHQRANNWINCKEARMVPREKAAFAYNQTVRRKVDPALVEWSGAGVFNARVFPLTPKKLHRIVMGYDVNLVRSGNNWNFELDLPEESGTCRVDVNVQDMDGVQVTVQPEVNQRKAVDEPRTKKMPVGYARHRWSNPKAKSIRVSFDQLKDVALTDSNESQGGFWGLQVTPELPIEVVSENSKALFLLDTSLSSSPDRFNVWLKLLRATLENNRDSLTEFNVLFFDVGSAFWRDGYVGNTPENLENLMEDCQQITLEGATDLYGAFGRVANTNWISGEAETGPDLFLLSDGAANWGETNLRLIQSQIQKRRLGNLFAYQTGLTGTAIANLRFLASQSGGAVFSVATEDEIKTASTAHRSRPWKLTKIEAEGTRDLLTAGRVEWVYPGQALTIVGRGELASELRIELTQGDKSETVVVHPTKLKSELASRLYGQIAVGQLESLGTRLFDISTAYARHFRVTGDTCSLLMLESEADYERFDIKPEEDLFVIKSKNAGQLVDETLQQFADEISNPKLQMLTWLKRLQSMPGMQFEISTALQLALGELEFEAISQPLDCDPRDNTSAPENYLNELVKPELNYEIIEQEYQRRAAKSVDEAIKVLSCLVELNPGDLVIARDVAFSAMELDRPAQAYPLLLAIAKARPYDASIYPAIGLCLARLKKADMAILFYEIALASSFENRNEDFHRIVAADYLHLLRQVTQGGLKTSVPDYINARCESIKNLLGFESADLLVTMMWNTDQTDVDLHVLEPSGQECCYELKDTRIGGHITQDITTGFGPEMYRISDAMSGKYQVSVKLFGNDQNRTSLRNKVHLTIYQGYGTAEERLLTKTIQLKTVGEKEPVLAIGVD